MKKKAIRGRKEKNRMQETILDSRLLGVAQQPNHCHLGGGIPPMSHFFSLPTRYF